MPGDKTKILVAVKGLAENLRMQDRVAQNLKNFRQIHGVRLSLETIEAKVVFDGDEIRALEVEEKNGAKEIIEEVDDRANGA